MKHWQPPGRFVVSIISCPVLFYCSFCCCFLLCSFSPPTLAGEWKGTRELIDGVAHVKNPAEPMEPPVVYELRELWRLESETEDGDVVFGEKIFNLKQVNKKIPTTYRTH